jgi:hypothetical protein
MRIVRLLSLGMDLRLKSTLDGFSPLANGAGKTAADGAAAKRS